MFEFDFDKTDRPITTPPQHQDKPSYQRQLAAHPECDDPDHPGCKDCDSEPHGESNAAESQ